jgi:hypothetical protein
MPETVLKGKGEIVKENDRVPFCTIISAPFNSNLGKSL